MFSGLLFATGCGKQAEVRVEPRQVCEVIDRVDTLKGQRVVVEGIFHRPDRSYAMLTDFRGFPCPSGGVGLVIDREPKAMRSSSGTVDDSFDRLLAATDRQPNHEMVVIFEGTIGVADNPFAPAPASMVVLVVTNVRSMKAIRPGHDREQ